MTLIRPTDSARLNTANAELQAANEELEERLEELRRAYLLDEERNRFLAMLAHGLRNPLAGIKSALYLLRRRHITDADRTAEQALRVAERQAQTQARLLEDLLDASRVVLGKITLRVEPTDVVAIVRQAVEAAEFGIRTRAHTLRADVPDLAVAVMADPVRLEQIVRQPARQRGQIHAAGRADHGRRLTDGGHGDADRHGYRCRHRAGAARTRLRPVHAGRWEPRARGRRPWHRSYRGEASRPACRASTR